MEDVMEEEIKVIKETVGPDDHIICALSGGVDSTVADTLVHKAIGNRLHCVFLDNGLLRYKEREHVFGLVGKKPSYLVQGTLYPDVIESCPTPGRGRTHSHTIKRTTTTFIRDFSLGPDFYISPALMKM